MWCVSVVVLLIKKLVENSPCMIQANLASFSGAVEEVAEMVRSSRFGRMLIKLCEMFDMNMVCFSCCIAGQKVGRKNSLHDSGKSGNFEWCC